MEFSSVPAHLEALLTQARAEFDQFSHADWKFSRAPGKWSRVEILGHLVDSAVNNHQRIVRAAIGGGYQGPGYEQDANVRMQAYRDEAPELVSTLWMGLNRHITHVLKQVKPSQLEFRCIVGDNPPGPLSALVSDYVAHLEHHLRQIFEGKTVEIRYSGLPWPPVPA
jgi:hypothetical protein